VGGKTLESVPENLKSAKKETGGEKDGTENEEISPHRNDKTTEAIARVETHERRSSCVH